MVYMGVLHKSWARVGPTLRMCAKKKQTRNLCSHNVQIKFEIMNEIYEIYMLIQAIK